MSNIYSASKSAGQNDKPCGQVRRQPLREHELLGIPKSTGKKGNMNPTTIEKPRMQPVRIKDLFGSTVCKKSTKPVCDRRMTTLPNTTHTVRRQLYNEPSRDQTSPVNQSTTISNALSHVNKNFFDIQSNAGGQTMPGPVHFSGLSKSDGKIKKTGGLGRERMQPERIKCLLESWERSQTVQPSARKTKTTEIRSQNVRRQLYGISHSSPTGTLKINRRSVAPSNLKSQKTCIVDATTVKPDNRKSIKPEMSKSTRKSCLLPPNSIRDKYLNLRQIEPITEESRLSITIENESKSMNQGRIKSNEAIDSSDKSRSRDPENFHESSGVIKITETNENDKLPSTLSLEGASNDNKKCDKNSEEKLNIEVPRPSVIMGISAKGIRKEQQNVSSDSEKSFLATSRRPLQELNRNSILLQPRLDAKSTSHEDLLGNNTSRRDRGESFYYENLPRNSFLESPTTASTSFVNIDVQTLSWVYGNLKLSVQSTEEQLFSMKRLLKTLEDVMKSHDTLAPRESKLNILANDDLPPPIAVLVNEDKIDESERKICPKNDVVPTISENIPEIPYVPEERTVDDSDNENPVFKNLDYQDKENNENVKPRRRSLRLAEKFSKSPKRADDSFSRIEQELNIVHVKTNNVPVITKSGKRFDPRSRRSIREYMALKSTISFLDTPDIKGFPTPRGEKDTPSHSRMIRRSLSRKLLTELDDLYAESPI